MPRTKVPAVEGLFTMDLDSPHLIGSKGRARDSYFFPARLAGSDPGCVHDDDREEVLLSRTGRVWSYTTAEYTPPPPYVAKEPYEPFVLAAVELEVESLVVLGQMIDGVNLDDMAIGMEVELVLDTLYVDDDQDYLVWKWKPLADAPAETDEN